MRAQHLFTCLISLIGLVTLDACQDHRIAGIPPGSASSRLRVKSLAEELPGNQVKLTTFSYDTQGRLSASITYQSPDSATAQVQRNKYFYDSQNRLVLYQRQVIARPGSIFGPFSEQYLYSYNEAGKVTQLKYYYAFSSVPGQLIVDLTGFNNPNTLQSTITPRYNAAGQLTGSTRTGYFQGNVSNETISQYTYSGDNVTSAAVAATFFNSTGGPSTNRQNVEWVYDTKVNPFYGVYVVPDYFGNVTTNFPNLVTFSRNNITGTGGVTYRYEYNAADLPTIRYTITDKITQTLRIEYESY